MRVTVDNMRNLNRAMGTLKTRYLPIVEALSELGPFVRDECLEPFGFWQEYYVVENDSIKPIYTHLDNVFDLWDEIEQDVRDWLSRQNDVRDWYTTERINRHRANFEPRLNDLERLLRELVELAGESVDKAGN